MDMEYNIGQTELIMKAIGILIKPKVKEHFGMLKEMSIVGSLKMIWPMVTVSIHI